MPSLPRQYSPHMLDPGAVSRFMRNHQMELEKIRAANGGGGMRDPNYDSREGRRPAPGLENTFGIGAGQPGGGGSAFNYTGGRQSDPLDRASPNRLNADGTRTFFPVGSTIPAEDPARQGSGASQRQQAAMEKFAGVANGSEVFRPDMSPLEQQIMGLNITDHARAQLLTQANDAASNERIEQLRIDNAPNRTPRPGLEDTFGPQGNTFGPLQKNLPPHMRDRRSRF